MSSKKNTVQPSVLRLVSAFEEVGIENETISLTKPDTAALQRVMQFIDSGRKDEDEERDIADDMTWMGRLCALVVSECVEGINEYQASILVSVAGGLDSELVARCFGLLGLTDYYKSIGVGLEKAQDAAMEDKVDQSPLS